MAGGEAGPAQLLDSRQRFHRASVLRERRALPNNLWAVRPVADAALGAVRAEPALRLLQLVSRLLVQALVVVHAGALIQTRGCCVSAGQSTGGATRARTESHIATSPPSPHMTHEYSHWLPDSSSCWLSRSVPPAPLCASSSPLATISKAWPARTRSCAAQQRLSAAVNSQPLLAAAYRVVATHEVSIGDPLVVRFFPAQKMDEVGPSLLREAFPVELGLEHLRRDWSAPACSGQATRRQEDSGKRKAPWRRRRRSSDRSHRLLAPPAGGGGAVSDARRGLARETAVAYREELRWRLRQRCLRTYTHHVKPSAAARATRKARVETCAAPSASS